MTGTTESGNEINPRMKLPPLAWAGTAPEPRGTRGLTLGRLILTVLMAAVVAIVAYAVSTSLPKPRQVWTIIGAASGVIARGVPYTLRSNEDSLVSE